MKERCGDCTWRNFLTGRCDIRRKRISYCSPVAPACSLFFKKETAVLKTKKERCRHERNSWLLGPDDGSKMLEWCWKCGALRKLKRIERNEYAPESYWIRPTGQDGENPWEKIKKLKGA